MLLLNLRNFWRNIRKDRLLLLALFLGLLLRGLNPTFGSPSVFVSNDEAIAHLSAFNMIAGKTPFSIANYTPLGAYIQIPFLTAGFIFMKMAGLVSSLAGFELFLLTHQGFFLFIPRLISALFGTLTILVIYKMTQLLFERKRVSIIAAFLTAVSFNLVHISHFGRPWAIAMFFFVLSVYFALKNKALFSFIAIALSYGFHQVGILGLPLVFYKLTKKNGLRVIPGLIVATLVIITLSSLTLKRGLLESISNNQSFLLRGKFLADLISGSDELSASFFRTLTENLSVYFLSNLFVTDGILIIFGVIGLAYYQHKKGIHFEIVFYIISYLIFASLFFHPLIRYLLPILLLLIPYSALATDLLFKKRVYLILAVIFIASINSLWWNKIFFSKPTFIRASEWTAANIPASSPIFYIGGRYQTFAPNAEAIERVQKVNPGFNDRLLKILPKGNLDNTRNIIYVSHFPGNNQLEQLKEAFGDYKTGYVIDYYIDPEQRIYNLDPHFFVVVQQFKPTRNGDVIKISEPLFDASWNFPTNNFKDKASMYELSDAGPYVDILFVSRAE